MEQPSLTSPIKQRFKIPVRTGMFAFIFFAVVIMGLRIQDVTADIINGRAVQAVTPAMAETSAKEAEKHETAKPEAAHENEGKKEESHAKEGEVGKEGMKDEKPDPINNDPVIAEDKENFSDAEVNILKRLSERRQEIDKRGRDLDQREALLKITEQRIDKKLGDMKTMQEQLRQTISSLSAEQKAKTESLVKIYEIMKPKDAANIFNALDMPVLLSVIANMKESRVAPILAAMDPQKAKQVTSALMDKKPIPPLP